LNLTSLEASVKLPTKLGNFLEGLAVSFQGRRRSSGWGIENLHPRRLQRADRGFGGDHRWKAKTVASLIEEGPGLFN